jgi:hydroxymethylpyrimidine kinase/phosphomethylpyrimidine kinase
MDCAYIPLKENHRRPQIQHSTFTVPSVPIAWTIAGSDSGGGAGIQADLKVMNAFGVHGCCVTTALTAQNTRGVSSVEAVSAKMIQAQLTALSADLPPAAIKTGMLGSAQTCRILAEFLEKATVPVICDPILKSTSGANLLEPAALDILIRGIFPRVAVLTPNLPEAQQIIGEPISQIEETATRILGTGVESVLIKGGHADATECRDYWTDGTQSLWLSSPRIESRATHGTGCILSAAIASALALGQTIPEAVVSAKTFLNQCLRSPANLGTGHGPMVLQPFRNDPEDAPTIR